MAMLGCYGILLLIEALNAHGSPEGNSLLFVLGLFLVVLSAISLAYFLLNRKPKTCTKDII